MRDDVDEKEHAPAGARRKCRQWASMPQGVSRLTGVWRQPDRRRHQSCAGAAQFARSAAAAHATRSRSEVWRRGVEGKGTVEAVWQSKKGGQTHLAGGEGGGGVGRGIAPGGRHVPLHALPPPAAVPMRGEAALTNCVY